MIELPQAKPAVIGLGYVGLPLALAFGRLRDTVAFDINPDRIKALKARPDNTGEYRPEDVAAAARLIFTSDKDDLRHANVYIVAVPTPVNQHKWPDLTPLMAATVTVADVLKVGDVVIFESTVYPGATEEVCVPILEQHSGLRFNEDFFVGYSPERINPGDRQRRLSDIVKVTSGSTPEAAEFIDALYRRVIHAGTHKAPSIAVAEAAKAVENTQRDVNIALANELALIFKRLGIDTEAVLEAAGTKWNFMPVRPGLVGGHCIGVDPYYLIHRAEQAGHYPELIRAARRINDGMSAYVSGEMIKLMALHGIGIVGSKILLLGLSFKENCPDLRNTRVVEIVSELSQFHAIVDVHDPHVDKAAARHECSLELCDAPSESAYDAILIAVAHDEFRRLGETGMRRWLKPEGVIYDARYALRQGESDSRL